MSNLSFFNVTWTFNGDVAATGKINQAQLDTQLANIATAQNLTKAALDRFTDGSNQIAPNTIGVAQLKPEVPLNMAGLDFGKMVDVVCTSAVTLSGLQTIDGYTLQSNDRVLCTAQADATTNVVYVAASGAWTVATDTPASYAFTSYRTYWVRNGLNYAGSIWKVSASGTWGSSPVTWVNIYRQAATQSGQTFYGSVTVNPASGAPLSISANSTLALSVDANANTLISKAYVESGYQYTTPANGGSAVIPAGCSSYILEPAALIASFTLTMPAAPINGQMLDISAGAFGITSLTLNANSGQTFATGAAITTLAASGFAKYMYRSTNSKWYRIG